MKAARTLRDIACAVLAQVVNIVTRAMAESPASERAIVANPARTSWQAGTLVEVAMQDVDAWCALFASGNPELRE